MKNAGGWDANTHLPSLSWVSDSMKVFTACLGMRWVCWLGQQLCLCNLGLWLGAHSTHSPFRQGLQEGGAAMDGHAPHCPPLHSTCPKAFCSLKLHCNYYWPNSSPPPLEFCMTDMDHYAPGEDFSPLSLLLSTVHRVSMVCSYCFATLTYGISTPYCPFYFLYRLQFLIPFKEWPT